MSWLTFARSSSPERYINRPVEPVVLSTIGLKTVVIRMGDVWHGLVQQWGQLRHQRIALEAELAAQRLESELLAERDDDEEKRRGWEHAELLRLRHADPDTQLNDGG